MRMPDLNLTMEDKEILSTDSDGLWLSDHHEESRMPRIPWWQGRIWSVQQRQSGLKTGGGVLGPGLKTGGRWS